MLLPETVRSATPGGWASGGGYAGPSPSPAFSRG
jgi:hypothetical protein